MKQNFFSRAGICLLFFVASLATSRGQNYDDVNYQDYNNRYNLQMQKMNQLLQLIRGWYVDTVNFSKLVEKGTVEMLKELDPHSRYIPKEDLAKEKEPLQGNFEGIGVQFQIIKDTLVVIQPVKGGPSEIVGIVAGDKIIQIDDTLAVGKICTNAWVFGKLRGKKGTKVVVKVKRGNNPDLYTFTIIRDKIPIHSIETYFMIDEVNGYIKLERFSQTTTQEFISAMRELKMRGMQNLLFDLRGNGGGYLQAAFEIVNEFIPANKLVVYTFNEQDKKRETYNTVKSGMFERGRLVVLIDEYSASGSEIVSGALQDWDRGIIVGRRSFGKGLVQKEFGLADGSATRITTSRYYIPSGRCIQKPYEGVEDYSRDLIKRYNSGELTHADSVHFPDSLKYYTDKKRVVYGGGGVMPDIFVPIDTVKVSDYYWKLHRNNIFNQFVIKYLEENKEKILADYPTFEQYNEKYKMDDLMWKSFYDFARQEGVTDSMTFDFKAYLNGFIAKNKDTLNKLFPSIDAVNQDNTFEEMLKSYILNEIEKYQKVQQCFDTKTYIERQIRTLIARSLYDRNKADKIWLEMDDAYLRAVEVLNNTALFKKMKITY
jgi:carboxyl-terminal processing protease